MAQSELAVGDRARVHKNLHLGCWSVVDPRTGRVVAHVGRVALRDAECRVQHAGLLAVRRSGVRAVHAYVIGTLAALVGTAERPTGAAAMSYNPFRLRPDGSTIDHFYRVTDLAPVWGAGVVVFDEEGAWFL